MMLDPVGMPSNPAVLDGVFHALGDPTRRALVERLSAGPLTASQLAEPLDMTLTAVGQHLRILERSGLIQTEKHGRTRTCRVQPSTLRAVSQWADFCRSEWEQRLDRLGEFLNEDK
jgi:DNA-binding transcriptional ArsR family regulator